MHGSQSAMQGNLSPGPCARVARHGMKEISTGMTLLLHFKNKLRALSVPCAGVASGSSAVQINVTSRSTAMFPRELSGVQHCAALSASPSEHRPLSVEGAHPRALWDLWLAGRKGRSPMPSSG